MPLLPLLLLLRRRRRRRERRPPLVATATTLRRFLLLRRTLKRRGSAWSAFASRGTRRCCRAGTCEFRYLFLFSIVFFFIPTFSRSTPPLTKKKTSLSLSIGACAAPARPSSAGPAAPSARSAACGSRRCCISGCRGQLLLLLLLRRRRRQTALRVECEIWKKLEVLCIFAEKESVRTTGVSLSLSPSLSLPCCLFY